MDIEPATDSTESSPARTISHDLPRFLLAPLPLPLLQPLLARIVTHVAGSQPVLFSRLGPHKSKRFLIDPENLPFVLLLQPEPENPQLLAYRRGNASVHDAFISGTFLTLLDMIDGRLDGDALFFSRDLAVSGDIEAVVALRNALDDLEGNVVETIAAAFGPFSGPVLLALSALKRAPLPGRP